MIEHCNEKKSPGKNASEPGENGAIFGRTAMEEFTELSEMFFFQENISLRDLVTIKCFGQFRETLFEVHP